MRLGLRTRLGFVLPSLVALAFLGGSAVRADEHDRDEVRYEGQERATLGIQISETRDGVSVLRVVEDGPADEAGLRRGDRIRKIDDKEIGSYRDLMRALREKEADDSVKITVRRDDEDREKEITLKKHGDVFDRDGRRAAQAGQQQFQRDQRFGPQDQWQRDQFGQQQRFQQPGQRGQQQFDQFGRQQRVQQPGMRGQQQFGQQERLAFDPDQATLGIRFRPLNGALQIVAVRPGGAAHKAGLQRGDFLLAIDGERIGTQRDIQRQLQEYSEGDDVKLLVVRDGMRGLVDAKLKKMDEDDMEELRAGPYPDRDRDRDRERERERERDQDDDNDDEDGEA